MILKEKVRNLPTTPGVYLMKDSLGKIIYVGKAKKLKNRVQSYFQNSKNHSKKVKKLVQTIKGFEVIQTDTEFEAFLLECQLIKEIKPFYNSKMKSPQTYPYIVIRKEKDRRKLKITQQPPIHEKDPTTLVFGPYTSKNTVEKAIQGMKESLRINCCNSSTSHSPCLNYFLGSCMGICLGEANLDQYERTIDKIISLLSGKDKSLLTEINEKMSIASERFDFESAAKYRDYLEAIHILLNKKKVIQLAAGTKNFVVIETFDNRTLKLFLIKGKNMLFQGKYDYALLEDGKLTSIIQSNIFMHFNRGNAKTPHQVTQEEIDEAQIIYNYLKANKTSLLLPQKWIDSENHAKLEETLNCFLKDLLLMNEKY